MAKVTALIGKKRCPGRLDLYLDGDYRCTVDELAAAKYGIKEGAEVDGELLMTAVADSERQRAFDVGMDAVSRHPCTVKQLKDKLFRQGFGADAVNEAVGKIAGYGYLDDREFARRYVEVNGAAKGSARLIFELKSKGVPADIIAETTADIDGREAALALARRHSRGKDVSDRAYTAKLVSYLIYRGFDRDEIAYCISELESENSANGEDL